MKRVYKKNPLDFGKLWKHHKTEILLGAGVAIVGLYFWKKHSKNAVVGKLENTPALPPATNNTTNIDHNMPVINKPTIEKQDLKDYVDYEYIPTRTTLIRYY